MRGTEAHSICASLNGDGQAMARLSLSRPATRSWRISAVGILSWSSAPASRMTDTAGVFVAISLQRRRGAALLTCIQKNRNSPNVLAGCHQIELAVSIQVFGDHETAASACRKIELGAKPPVPVTREDGGPRGITDGNGKVQFTTGKPPPWKCACPKMGR